jgi:hypothetical protein
MSTLPHHRLSYSLVVCVVLPRDGVSYPPKEHVACMEHAKHRYKTLENVAIENRKHEIR